VNGWTVQLRLVTDQSFAGRESLHADRTHERRVRRLQIKSRKYRSVTINTVRASLSVVGINQIYLDDETKKT